MEKQCQEYVDLLESPTNGWGQHMHPIHGQSHFFLMFLFKTYGKENVNKWLDNHYGRIDQ